MGRCEHTYSGHQKGVFGVQFDPYKIVSCAGDHKIKIWDRQTGDNVATLTGHTDVIRAIQFDDTKIVTTCLFWPSRSMSSSPKMMLLVVQVSGSSTQDKSVKIWRFD